MRFGKRFGYDVHPFDCMIKVKVLWGKLELTRN